MPVCKFYLKGFCKFGNKCRFEHPPLQQTRDHHHQRQKSSTQESECITSLSDLLQQDLVTCLPIYHYSCYGNPNSGFSNLITGDLSMEELRWRAYAEGRETGSLTNYTAFVRQIEEYYQMEREKLLRIEEEQQKAVPQTQKITSMPIRIFPLPLERDLVAFGAEHFSLNAIPEIPPTPEFC